MGQEMTREELIELLGATTANVNSQFELWLTVTFAVIIASHLAGHSLAKGLKHLIATLYTAVSILLFLMLFEALRTAAGILGESIQDYYGDPVRLSIAILRVGVWVLGTVATLVFIYKGGGRVDDT
jgi:hypothetical protein